MDGSSKVLSLETASEIESTVGLMDAYLITINGGQDVLIFGGQTSQYYLQFVWKYNLVVTQLKVFVCNSVKEVVFKAI